MSDIWYSSPKILLNNALDFFPSKKMNTNEILNSFVRLSLYIGFIYCILQKIEKASFIILITLIFTYLLHQMHNETVNAIEPYIVKPTVDNPFMNIQLSDFSKQGERNIEKAYDSVFENENIKKDIENKFTKTPYLSKENIFSEYSGRQFYTMPVSSIPSKQGQYANWLYKHKGLTCKENNNSCKI